MPFRVLIIFLFLLVFQPIQAMALNASDVHKWPLDPLDLRHLNKVMSEYSAKRWESKILKSYTPKDPLVHKIIKWREFKGGSPAVNFTEIANFIKYNPSWPNQELLRKNAEYTIADYTNPDEVIKWFAINTPIPGKKVRLKRPLTPVGKQRLAEAMLLVKNKYIFDKKIIFMLIRDAFVETDFTPKSEKNFLKKFFKVLTQNDYQRRIDRLLTDRRITDAKRIYKYLDGNYRKVFNARIAMIRSKKGVDNLVAQVPYNLRNDTGLLYERARYRDKKKNLDGVIQILKKLPTKVDNPEKWWDLRRKSIRTLIEKNRWHDAYNLAKNHSVRYNRKIIAESEWYAGWVALRFVNNYRASFEHFKRIYDVSRSPISIARGTYWMGRSLDAQGKKQQAKKWYQVAARYPATFYGQLAFVKLGKRVFDQPLPSSISKTDVARYRNNELAKAAYYMLSIGEDKLGKLFMQGAAKAATTAGERVLAAQMGLARNRYDYSLRVAKEIYKDKHEVVINALFPVFNLTSVKGGKIKKPAEEIILSIIRQESEFDVSAKSWVGAAGLMQLMPPTAKEVCRKIGVTYSKKRLFSDPKYNVTLGAYYLDEKIRSFKGSFLMAFAAYNAGAGNVNKWVKKNGDPRKMQLNEVIDWIEKIPFSETNNYVQRALENVQMYRIAVSGKKYRNINIDKDLMR